MNLSELSDKLNKIVGSNVFGEFADSGCDVLLSEFLMGYHLNYNNSLDSEYGIKFLEQIGGDSEDDPCYSVFRIKDTLYKVEYSYNSFNGFNYDHMTLRSFRLNKVLKH